MTMNRTPWTARIGVVVALVAGVFLLPGVVLGGRDGLLGAGSSLHIDVGDADTRVSISRNGYAATLEVEGKFKLAEDESDVATLEPNGSFELMEKKDGVKQEYRVEADSAGKLSRSYERSNKPAPYDAAAKQWVAAALPRLMRESGIDAEARVARFLARGGPSAVLDEIEQIGSDYGRASYIGELLGQAQLAPAELDRMLKVARGIGSDYEKRRALSAALDKQKVAAPQLAVMLEAGATIGSDYERAELLLAAAPQLRTDAAARDAWLAAADGIGSDYELRRTLEAGVAKNRDDRALVAGALAVGGKRISSDYELRVLLQEAAKRADGAIVAPYLAATREVDSDYERREALCTLLDEMPKLDGTALGGVLESTAEMGSSFERLQVLDKLAPLVAGDAALVQRYRDAARDLDDYERGEALKALDDATRL